MIITRTPFRISIGGGGTDLPSYYEKFGGFFISAAINKYIYLALNRSFTPEYQVKYSHFETCESIADIKHPIVREAFRMLDIEPGIEMVSVADIPAGTGLGSSGSFNVGLLRGLHAWKREHISAHALAEEACHIELELLSEPIGKQDQYIAAFGGITCFSIDAHGAVNVSPLRISAETLHDLEDNLLLFFTGYSRSASAILGEQKKQSESANKEMLDNLHFIKEIGLSIKEALERSDTRRFGELLHEHWLHKKKRAGGVSNEVVNRLYDVGHAHGAVGGKLIGAGGGGFLMFYASDHTALREAMRVEGLPEVRFAFDFHGSSVIVSD
jgi:D-glycero-alpha-D-manno-heptose-7-phosphate kinase